MSDEPSSEVTVHDLGRTVVIVPVHDNGASLRELSSRLMATERATGSRWRYLFVDDASSDASWEVITALAGESTRTAGLRLGANVGQVRAFCAAVAASGADTILTIDADLEDPPEGLALLHAAGLRGHDFVNGRRTARVRTRPWRGLLSALFNVAAKPRARVPVRDIGSGVTLMSRAVADEVVRATDRRAVQIVKPVMVRAARRPTEVRLPRSERAGSSGYSVRQLVGFALEYLLPSSRPRPAGRRGPAPAATVEVVDRVGWVAEA